MRTGADRERRRVGCACRNLTARPTSRQRRARRGAGDAGRVSRAAVHITLRRLEEKGLVSSWMSEPTAERGGKPRRCVRVETRGLQLLRESRAAMDRMWRGLDPRLEGVR